MNKKLPQLSRKGMQVKGGVLCFKFITESTFILDPTLGLKGCNGKLSFSLQSNKKEIKNQSLL